MTKHSSQKEVSRLKLDFDKSSHLGELLEKLDGAETEQAVTHIRDTLIIALGELSDERRASLNEIFNDAGIFEAIREKRKYLNGKKAKVRAEREADRKEREAMPGVFKVVTVKPGRSSGKGRKRVQKRNSQVELFFGFSKKGKEIVRIHQIKSGNSRTLTPGSTYLLSHPQGMPESLRNALDENDFASIMAEARVKRDSLKSADGTELTKKAA